MIASSSTPRNGHPDTKMARRAALGSFLGSVIEYYDFFIYGTAAALVFGHLFFPGEDPAVGTISALATFGVGYIARPIGALVFGHLGDIIGRKKVLLLTLVLMGASSFAIGLLPTYSSIGLAAPILLGALRVLTGLSAGGEQVGASLLTMEHSPKGKRGLYASWMLNGSATGSILATAVFIPVAALPQESIDSWGWRIPFFLSVVMFIVTAVIRNSITESPEFERRLAQRRQEPKKSVPVLTLFKTQPRAFVIVLTCAFIVTVQTTVTVFGLSYAVNENGISKSAMLAAISASQFVALFFHPFFGWLADRTGKKSVFAVGAMLCAAGVFAFFGSIQTGSVVLIFVITIALKGIVYAAPNGVWPSFYSEMFNPEVRYTGVGLATQLSFVLTGFAPTISYAILGGGDAGWLPVAAFISVCCILSAGAALLSRPAPVEGASQAPGVSSENVR